MPARYFILFAAFQLAAPVPPAEPFHFDILGDRTGEAQKDIYERVWHQAASENPAFIVATGDTIEGLKDENADAEWQRMQQMLEPYRRFRLYLAPGNHDIWSSLSEKLFRKYAEEPPHYSFDAGPVHFTVLDNSRSEEFSAEELAFLEQDLRMHASRPVKFIISHRPSWILNALLRNPNFPLHQLAKKYGVQYVIAGHVHQMLHYNLEGIEYVSMPSSGGHLRASGKYEDGWFFGYATISIRKYEPNFQIHELGGRVTALSEWGAAGLIDRK